MSDVERARALIEAVTPLLELFAMVDDVFTEDDALTPAKRKMSLGRVYEQWKRTRRALDPGWDPHARPRRRMGPRPILHPTEEQMDGFTG